MILVVILDPETMAPWFPGAELALLQNSVRRRLRGPKLHRAQIKGSKTPRGQFAFNLWPRILGPRNLRPAVVLDPSTVPAEFTSNATWARKLTEA